MSRDVFDRDNLRQKVAEFFSHQEHPALDNIFYPIDREPESLIENEQADYQLAENAIEELLAEISELLERSLVHRNLKYELEEKLVSQWIDIEASRIFLDTEQQEISAGAYSLPKDESVNRLKNLESELDATGSIRRDRREAVDWRKLDTAEATSRIHLEGIRAGFMSTIRNRTEMREAAENTEKNRIGYERLDASASHSEVDHRFKILPSKIDIQRESAEYLSARESIKQQEWRHRKNLHDIKVYAAKSHLGTNYLQRLSELEKVFAKDFASLWVRCETLASGMDKLLALQHPVPKLGDDILSRLVVWYRDLVDALSKVFECDQQANVPIRVRDRLSDDEWRYFLSSGRCSLVLDEDDFPSQCLVRTRSVGVAIEGLRFQEFAQIHLKLPIEAFVIQVDGSKNKISQNPSTLMIADATTPIPAQVVASGSSRNCRNFSPIGLWQLEFSNYPSTKGMLSNIENLTLVVSTIFQPRGG